MFLLIGSEEVSGLAFVEIFRALFLNAFESAGEVGLFEGFAEFVERAVFEEDAFGFGKLREPFDEVL